MDSHLEKQMPRKLVNIVRERDLVALVPYCRTRNYRELIREATQAGVDLEELEEMLHEIS